MLKPKLMIKLERIARLRLFSGYTDKVICDVLQISQGGLSRIIALDEYKAIEERLLAGEVADLDVALAGKKDEIRKAFSPLVPAACRALQDAVLQRRDLKTAVSAAVQILDRDPDGTFAAISKNAPAQPSLPASILANAAAEAKTITGIPKVVSPPDRNIN